MIGLLYVLKLASALAGFLEILAYFQNDTIYYAKVSKSTQGNSSYQMIGVFLSDQTLLLPFHYFFNRIQHTKKVVTKELPNRWFAILILFFRSTNYVI